MNASVELPLHCGEVGGEGNQETILGLLPPTSDRGRRHRIKISRGAIGLTTLGLLAAVLVGCAAPSGNGLGPMLDPQLSTEQAQQAAVNPGLDERRDEMLFQLAEARWRRNDVAACQQTLEEIVGHNPGHRAAHLRLAELYLLK